MDENKTPGGDLWDDGAYGTGRTKPPKTHSGMVALLLVLIIFLTGIITVLGLLNVRLFQQLNTQEELPEEEDTLPISFSEEKPAEPLIPADGIDDRQIFCKNTTIDLNTSPQSVSTVPEEGGVSLQDIYEKNIPSVVSIRVQTPAGEAAGTGVIVSQDGYVVTNNHVIENAKALTVQLTDDRVLSATLVGKDSISDLAVLHINAPHLVAAEFGDSDSLRVGDTVAAIGDPLGVDLRGTMTDGIVSAINRDVTMGGRTMTLIQTNAALNSGNSGGPLINCYGQVIGINTMKIGTFTNQAGVEGLGFAIPSTTVKEVVDQIVAQGYVSGRPTLGVKGECLSAFYQHYYRLPAGLFVTEVIPGSAAQEGGIQPGNILLSIGKERIYSSDDLTRALYHYNVGDTVEVVVFVNGSQELFTLTLSEYRG